MFIKKNDEVPIYYAGFREKIQIRRDHVICLNLEI